MTESQWDEGEDDHLIHEGGYSYTDYYGDEGDSADEEIGVELAEQIWCSSYSAGRKDFDFLVNHDE